MTIWHVHRLRFHAIEKLAIAAEKNIDYLVSGHCSHATARIYHHNQFGSHFCHRLH